jgi:hypothetical protein
MRLTLDLRSSRDKNARCRAVDKCPRRCSPCVPKLAERVRGTPMLGLGPAARQASAINRGLLDAMQLQPCGHAAAQLDSATTSWLELHFTRCSSRMWRKQRRGGGLRAGVGKSTTPPSPFPFLANTRDTHKECHRKNWLTSTCARHAWICTGLQQQLASSTRLFLRNALFHASPLTC